MRGFIHQSGWKATKGIRRAYWGVLTNDDLPKTNGKYSPIVTQLQARYQATKEMGLELSDQISDDSSKGST